MFILFKLNTSDILNKYGLMDHLRKKKLIYVINYLLFIIFCEKVEITILLILIILLIIIA